MLPFGQDFRSFWYLAIWGLCTVARAEAVVHVYRWIGHRLAGWVPVWVRHRFAIMSSNET